MNVLKPGKQLAIISALVEGTSIRSVERMTGVHRDTIMRLLVRVGERCGHLLDEHLHGSIPATCRLTKSGPSWERKSAG